MLWRRRGRKGSVAAQLAYRVARQLSVHVSRALDSMDGDRVKKSDITNIIRVGTRRNTS